MYEATAAILTRYCTNPKGDELSIWYPDGTLIVQAHQTIFRVYSGLLSSQSSVFQDMLQFPQPEEADLYEGCPLVKIYDDPVDVYYFLQATHSTCVDITAKPSALLILSKEPLLSAKN